MIAENHDHVFRGEKTKTLLVPDLAGYITGDMIEMEGGYLASSNNASFFMLLFQRIPVDTSKDPPSAV